MRDCNFKTSTLSPEKLPRASLRYEFYFLVLKTIYRFYHSKIKFSTFAPPFNILHLFLTYLLDDIKKRKLGITFKGIFVLNVKNTKEYSPQ